VVATEGFIALDVIKAVLIDEGKKQPGLGP
jgi:hypothetical protein